MLSHRFQIGAWHNTIQVNVLNLTNKLYYTGSFPIALDWIQLAGSEHSRLLCA